MKHQLRISCFARVQIGAKPISQRFPVEAQAKFAYRLHVVRIAPDPHLCRDKTDVIRPLTFQGSGTMQIVRASHLPPISASTTVRVSCGPDKSCQARPGWLKGCRCRTAMPAKVGRLLCAAFIPRG